MIMCFKCNDGMYAISHKLCMGRCPICGIRKVITKWSK